jgi:hypothetical protein
VTGRRVEVAIEGVPTDDGSRLIEREALRFVDGPVPVTAPGPDGEYASRLVGTATDFERDGDVVSCEVSLSKGFDHIDLRRTNAHIEIDDVTFDRGDGDPMTVKDGLLRAVFLSDGPHSWSALDRREPAVPTVPAPTPPSYRDVVRATLDAHFVVYQGRDGVVPHGEWKCQCDKRFGFSDTVVDHQADEVIAALREAGL